MTVTRRENCPSLKNQRSSSHLVVQVVELQSRVVASVERLHRLASADGQSQREHGESQHHEHHHAALQRPASRRRLPPADAGVLEVAFRHDDQARSWSRAGGGRLSGGGGNSRRCGGGGG